MISNVSLTSIWVQNIEESKDFYTRVLGFDLRDDITVDEFRWCTVSHPTQPELSIHLTVPSAPLPDYLITAMRRAQDEGGLPAIGLNVDDCRATVDELKGKGVEFIQDAEERSYGVEAIMRDNSGNWLVLVEPREYTDVDFEGVDLG